RSYGQDVRLRHGSQVRGLEGDERLSVARGPHELDLEGVVAVKLDDGSHVAGAQPVLRDIVDQDNRIEQLECHHALGTTVTSLTSGLPRSLIHMVRIEAVAMGPFNCPTTVYFRPNSV